MSGLFTKRSAQVMNLANESAHRFNHEYIGAEHILLGLLQDDGSAALILKNLGVNIDAMRQDMEGVMLRGPSSVEAAKLPQTPRAKKIIEYAMLEANPLQKGGRMADQVDILVGLLVDNESAAALILSKHGITADNVRSEAQKLRTRE